MIEKTKKHRKGFISEEDISTLLQKYTATTVLALLQEVAQYPDVKLDWNALVKKTSTGISNAREYQMLWRHLAYRDSLHELEDGAEPLDDDSDLECELEAFPHVSSEASVEAAACVKVLTASGLSSNSGVPNSSTVEAPLTINIPNGPSFRASSESSQPAWSMRGINITVPVSVQKQSLPTMTSNEGLDANGLASSSMPARRKRKPWSEAEDLELIAAVEKCGEGNWANILKGDFKGDRTASQLSQRWAIIRKKRGNLNVGINHSGSQRTESQVAATHAANHALSIALAGSPAKNLTAGPVGTSSNGTSVNSVLLHPSVAEAPLLGSSTSQGQRQSRHVPIPAKPSPLAPLGPASKSRVTAKKTFAKSNLSSELMASATAVAPGSHSTSPSDAASLLKAAQGKNAVCGKSSAAPSIKPSIPGDTSIHVKASPGAGSGMGTASLSSKPAVTSAVLCPGSVEVASSTVQQPSSSSVLTSNISSDGNNAVSSRAAAIHPPKPEFKHAEEVKVMPDDAPKAKLSKPDDAPKGLVQKDGACFLGKELCREAQEEKTAQTNSEKELEKQATVSENPSASQCMEAAGNVISSHAEESQRGNDSKKMASPVTEHEKPGHVKDNYENGNVNKQETDLSAMETDECSKN